MNCSLINPTLLLHKSFHKSLINRIRYLSISLQIVVNIHFEILLRLPLDPVDRTIKVSPGLVFIHPFRDKIGHTDFELLR